MEELHLQESKKNPETFAVKAVFHDIFTHYWMESGLFMSKNKVLELVSALLLFFLSAYLILKPHFIQVYSQKVS